MEFGMDFNFFKRTLGLRKTAEYIAQAGFTQLDYTPNFRNDNWKDEMHEAMSIFADLGLKVHQTHAPFNRYHQYDGFDHYHLCLERCAEATALMGADFMVVHGDEFDFKKQEFSTEAILDFNHKLFLPYVESAKDNGYKVAFETVFCRAGRRHLPDPPTVDELLDLIASFNSESAVCCWDFGHCFVEFEHEAPNWIRKFGSLIQCTHVHDNIGNDSHQMPMTGDIDWKETITAMKDIGYNGVMSIEYAHGCLPDFMLKDFIKMSYTAVEYVWNHSK